MTTPAPLDKALELVTTEAGKAYVRKLWEGKRGGVPDEGGKYRKYEPVTKGEEIKRWRLYVADEEWLTAIGWGIQLRIHRDAREHEELQGLRSHIAGKGDIPSLWIAEAVECRILQLILEKLTERGRTRDQIASSIRTFLANIQRYTKFVKDTDRREDLARTVGGVLQFVKPEFYGIAGAGIMEIVTRRVVGDVMASPMEYSVVSKVHDQDLAVVFCLEGPGYRPPKPASPAPKKRGRPKKKLARR